MDKKEIIEACLFLREHNHTIPSETIEFMKDVSIRELEKISNGRECFSCEHDGFQSLFRSECTGCYKGSKMKNFKLKHL